MAGRPCSICAHAKHAEIDSALLAGEALRAIARGSHVKPDALRRHRDAHIPQACAQAAEEARATVEIAYGGTLAAEVARLRTEAAEIGAEARRTQDLRVALLAIERQGRLVELQAKLIGELDSRAPVNILAIPGFVAIVERLEHELVLAYPGAERVIDRVLEEAERGGEIGLRSQTDVLASPQWVRVRNTLVRALERYPQARQAVATALEALGAGG